MQNSAYNIIDNLLVPHTLFTRACDRIRINYEASRTCREPICLALIGESRTGKSRCLEYVENLFPRQRTEESMLIPILRIKTPAKPTVKGLVEACLRNIGDPHWDSRGSESTKTERLKKILRRTDTTMVMIDEFQHFYDQGSHKVQHHVADWLKILVDDAKLALVVSGIPSCMAVINQNEQLRGRFTSALHMSRFDWINRNDREDFIDTLVALQEGLSDYDMPDLDSEEMAFRFYCASGGLIGYVTKIMRQALWNAINANTRTIRMQDLAVACDEALWRHQPDRPYSPFDPQFSAVPTEHKVKLAQHIGKTDLDESALPGASTPMSRSPSKPGKAH